MFAGNTNARDYAKRPWQRRDSNNPPDLDELFNELSGKFGKWFKPKDSSTNQSSGRGSDDGGDNRGGNGGFVKEINLPSKFLVLAGLVLVLVIWVTAGFYVINEKERAVVLRLGKYHAVLQPGLQWQPYFIDKVTKINVTQLRDFATQGLMLTEDENIVDVDLVVQYRIDNPEYFLLKVVDPAGSVALAVDSAIRHVVGSSTMDKVITVGRAEVAQEVMQRAQAYQDNYQTGIKIVQVNVREARAPAEVKPAFDDVISAREDQERYINQATTYANGVVPEARGKAQRMREEANGYKEQVVAQAEGEAERFSKLLASYRIAPEVTRQRLYIETMQKVLSNSSKVLVDTSDGNSIMYLPLDQIIKNSKDVSAETNNSSANQTNNQTSNQTYGSADANIPMIAAKVADYLRNNAGRSTRR